ncbi:hypothetical protein HDU76_004515, partial [Blyttiomyces sp. JEL0837]
MSTPLPNGWAAHWDPNYGQYYYVSPTGQSTWYDPRVTPGYGGGGGGPVMGGGVNRPANVVMAPGVDGGVGMVKRGSMLDMQADPNLNGLYDPFALKGQSPASSYQTDSSLSNLVN